MTTLRGSTCLRAAAFTAAALLTMASAARAQEQKEPHRTDWLYRAKWGVMYHLCVPKTPATYSKAIDAVDVKGLARQLHDVGAGYFLITALHGRGPIAPNAAYEKKYPGEAPKRDLILDLADALAEHDIKLMLYLSTGMKYPPHEANTKFHASVVEEYSKRYGAKVKGWWFDNNTNRPDLQKLIVDAARSGNPDVLVAFSPPKRPVRATKFDDYTAGNTHGPVYARCTGRWVDGAQWHMLSYLGNTWGGGRNWNPRWPLSKTLRFQKKFMELGGVITWDVPHHPNGLLAEPMIPVLKAIGELSAKIHRE